MFLTVDPHVPNVFPFILHCSWNPEGWLGIEERGQKEKDMGGNIRVPSEV